MQISGSSLSALHAHSTKMNVIANNVANVNTEEFKKSDAVLNEGNNSTVYPTVQKDISPGPLTTEPGVQGVIELSNVDIAEEITETVPTQRGFEANTKLIQTQDEMLGSVLDIIS